MDQKLKRDAGKAPLGLLPTGPLLEVAEVLRFGADKYSPHGWRVGMDHSRLIDAILRHTLAYNDGEDLDIDSGLSHLAHAACGLLFLLEYRAQGLGTDDRWAKPADRLDDLYNLLFALNADLGVIHTPELRAELSSPDLTRHRVLGLLLSLPRTGEDNQNNYDIRGMVHPYLAKWYPLDELPRPLAELNSDLEEVIGSLAPVFDPAFVEGPPANYAHVVYNRLGSEVPRLPWWMIIAKFRRAQRLFEFDRAVSERNSRIYSKEYQDFRHRLAHGYLLHEEELHKGLAHALGCVISHVLIDPTFSRRWGGVAI